MSRGTDREMDEARDRQGEIERQRHSETGIEEGGPEREKEIDRQRAKQDQRE